MKLTRAIPALLALSMLTGCDMTAFLPKDGTDSGQNPNTNNFSNKLTEAELKSVAALQSGLIDASSQGLAAAGAVNTLKSVAALRSVSAYRISALTWPAGADITWAEVDEEHPQFETLNGKFAGRMGTSGPSEEAPDNIPGWYLDGAFTLTPQFTAAGSASIITNGETVTLSTLDKLAATASVELKIDSVPAVDDLQGLKDSTIAVTLTKAKGAPSNLLSGEFTLKPQGGKASKGALFVNIVYDSWTVEIPSKDENNNLIFISLSKDADGACSGRVYGAKEGKIDTTAEKAKFSWGKDNKLKYNGKSTDVTMPL